MGSKRPLFLKCMWEGSKGAMPLTIAKGQKWGDGQGKKRLQNMDP